ncbi:MAG: helix-turn-helix transcriptional regulator [Nocardioidaceae bacterium]
MPRKTMSLRPDARDALRVLGGEIKRARLARDWSVVDTAARVGVSPMTYAGVERGLGGTAIGTVFNAASILGVPLFGTTDAVEIARLRRSGERDMGLLRTRASGSRKRTPVSRAGRVDGYPE